MKCVSTDTIREVARAYDPSPGIQRSSYGGSGPAVSDWLQSCSELSKGVLSVIDQTINRKKSMVLEGVNILPSEELLDRWRKGGGVGVGILLKLGDRERHYQQIIKRGFGPQIQNFTRICEIQEEMERRAKQSNWIQIDQNSYPEKYYHHLVLDIVSHNIK